MSWFILGLILLVGVVTLARLFAQGDPKKVAKAVRYGGGGAAGLIAVVLALTGRLSLAIPAFAVSAWLFGKRTPFAFPNWAGFGQRSAGQRSQVTTDYLEMTLDHDTGAMTGRVLKGAFAGQALDALSDSDLTQLVEECRGADPQGARLLEALVARRAGAEWQDSGGQSAGGRERPRPSGGPMTRDQAYEILGLRPGASADEVRKAHRALMLKLHPDQGGTTFLAAQINQAKELLLG